MNQKAPTFSKNRLEGSLADSSLTNVLDACKRHMVTGRIRIEAGGKEGELLLRAGFVDKASYGDLEGDEAREKMETFRDGAYEIIQRLPDLGGDLGDAAQMEGEISEIKLVELMRHCEDNALSCSITVVSEFERGEIVYRGGEITHVELNGRPDMDAIVDIVNFEKGRFRIQAPPLDTAIEGWPVAREPTAPMVVKDLKEKEPGGGRPITETEELPKIDADADEAETPEEPAAEEDSDLAPARPPGLLRRFFRAILRFFGLKKRID